MGTLNDSANIFTGAALDAFNAIAGAAEEMRKAMVRVCSAKQTSTSGVNGTTTTKRT